MICSPGHAAEIPVSLKAKRGVISYKSKCSNAGIITGPNGVFIYFLKVDLWERRDRPAKSIYNQLVKWNQLNPDERRQTNTTFVVGTVVYFNAVSQLSDQDGSKIPYLATSVWTEPSMEWLTQNKVTEPPEIPQRCIKPCTWSQLRNVNINPHQKFPDFPGISTIEILDSKPLEPREPRYPALLQDLVRADGFVGQLSQIICGGRIIGPNGESVYFGPDAILDLMEFKWTPFNCLSTKRRKKQAGHLQRGNPVHFNAKLVPNTTYADDPFTHIANHVISGRTLAKAQELGIPLPDLDENLLSDVTLEKFWRVNRNPEIEFPKAKPLLEKAKRKAEDQDPDSSAKRRRTDSTLDGSEVNKEPPLVCSDLPSDLQDGVDSKGIILGVELGEGDVELGEDDIELGEGDVELGEDDVKLGEDVIELGESEHQNSDKHLTNDDTDPEANVVEQASDFAENSASSN